MNVLSDSIDMMLYSPIFLCFVFFFNDTATTEIYTLSLHDALPSTPRETAFSADLGGSSNYLSENLKV